MMLFQKQSKTHNKKIVVADDNWKENFIFTKKIKFNILPEEYHEILVLGLELNIAFHCEEVQESRIWE